MKNNLLFGLDWIFTCFGVFWAGIVIYASFLNEFNFELWISSFWVIAIFLFPLIRIIVKFLSEMNWKDFEYSFKKNYKSRAKKRWEY